ncbi:MAG TPA: hypothetical protein VHW24_24980, partial [Bryobacteraceae bacterium]|nr:hypothetical protein [Bryobacteraceae bacterium]
NEQEPLSDGELDGLLSEWMIDAPPERLQMLRLPGRNMQRVKRSWPLFAAAATAAGLMGLVLIHKAPPRSKPTAEGAAGFLPIPYTLPLGDGESQRVLRMTMPMAALTATGLRFPAMDPSMVVTADVIVGDDGRARAVRLVSAVSEAQKETR